MKRAEGPILKDVVLIGAGHAHVGVLRDFGMSPIQGLRITLVTRQVHTPYSGMLPGLVTGHYDADDVHIDTAPLTRFAGARLYQAEVTGLDLSARRVLCQDRPPVPFDLLSLDIGSTPGGADVPGAAEHAIPVKPIDQFQIRFEAARQRILQAGGMASIAVVGGGAAGVELALALDGRLKRDIARAGGDVRGCKVTVLAATPTILPTLANGARRRVERILAERGLEVMTRARVTRVDERRVEIEGAAPQTFDVVFWATQAAAAPWLGSTGLQLDAHGFIAVDATLQSLSHRGVFAVGDVASLRDHDLPKSGVYAVRQGPYLSDNIRRTLADRPLRRYRPQRASLYLITTGERYAVGSRNGCSFEGAWAWRWKDWIDRAFMEKFSKLPEMHQAEVAAPPGIADRTTITDIPAAGMRCGGCGAKVAAGVLSRALARLAPAARSNVVIGLDAADDAAVIDQGGATLSVQSVDYFRSMIDDPYTFGRIAANHALGDLYAMGAEPQTALAIATLPYGIEAKVEADLTDLMAGANATLREAACTLVGGHTSEGAELALGFAVTGSVDRDMVLRKSGMRPGDVVILTKPIGTGTLLAAHMHGKAKARWVMAALEQMAQSNRLAATALRRHGVHAATDVTGFGLLGHLAEMVHASGVDATLRLADIPLLDGAPETIAVGIVSSLQPQNLLIGHTISNRDAASAHATFPLLFDPQTAGGLLASVPAEQAEACVAALVAAGYARAAVIAAVHPRSGSAKPIVVDVSAADRVIQTRQP